MFNNIDKLCIEINKEISRAMVVLDSFSKVNTRSNILNKYLSLLLKLIIGILIVATLVVISPIIFIVSSIFVLVSLVTLPIYLFIR